MFERRPEMITAFVAVFVVISLLSVLLFLLAPPQPRAVGAATTQTDGVAYFKKLTQITTTSTTTTTTPIVTTTKAQPVTTTTARPYYATDGSYIQELIASFFPENPGLWIAIARCESGLNPNAYNPEGASGLFQVMMPLHADMVLPGENIFDPTVNARIARSLSRNGTSTVAWNASKGCWN